MAKTRYWTIRDVVILTHARLCDEGNPKGAPTWREGSALLSVSRQRVQLFDISLAWHIGQPLSDLSAYVGFMREHYYGGTGNNLELRVADGRAECGVRALTVDFNVYLEGKFLNFIRAGALWSLGFEHIGSGWSFYA